MKESFTGNMGQNPVIAAVKSEDKLSAAVESDCKIVFILCGSIFNLKEMVDRAKGAGKTVFIHVDLIEGFSRDAVALTYINEKIHPDGIISTKNSQLKAAKQMGLLTVQRLFIVDSMSIETTVKAAQSAMPDAVEVMPGIMPVIIERLSAMIDIPLIAGGLISDKNDVEQAVKSGAKGVSTSDVHLW